MVANGYSPYMEGISMIYHTETDPQTIIVGEPLLGPVAAVTEAGLDEVPKIRGMLEVGLKREFPLHDDGFRVLDWGLNSYWVLQHDGNVEVVIGMSQRETQRYMEWLQENVPGHLMEYKGKYFSFSDWTA
ncbi:MAG: hypothetical protein J4F28_07065 [Nitrosopumilaceae archaeon]|nr:hypothetical protein [Nitrosopumilaceae archaeon]